MNLSIGTPVTHKNFGTGVIINIKNRENDLPIYVVKFDHNIRSSLIGYTKQYIDTANFLEAAFDEGYFIKNENN